MDTGGVKDLPKEVHPFSRAFAHARPSPLILNEPLGCKESSFKNTGIPVFVLVV